MRCCIISGSPRTVMRFVQLSGRIQGRLLGVLEQPLAAVEEFSKLADSSFA